MVTHPRDIIYSDTFQSATDGAERKNTRESLGTLFTLIAHSKKRDDPNFMLHIYGTMNHGNISPDAPFPQVQAFIENGSLTPESFHAYMPEFSAQYEAAGGNLLDLIASVESGGDYNIINGGSHINLTGMTINQVLKWQEENGEKACGRYQIKPDTLSDLVKQCGLTGDEPYNEQMQDYLATGLLERRGLSGFLAGDMSEEKFMANLSKEWRALPENHENMSYYGDNEYTQVSANQVSASLKNLFNTDINDQQEVREISYTPSGNIPNPLA